MLIRSGNVLFSPHFWRRHTLNIHISCFHNPSIATKQYKLVVNQIPPCEIIFSERMRADLHASLAGSHWKTLFRCLCSYLKLKAKWSEPGKVTCLGSTYIQGTTFESLLVLVKLFLCFLYCCFFCIGVLYIHLKTFFWGIMWRQMKSHF